MQRTFRVNSLRHTRNHAHGADAGAGAGAAGHLFPPPRRWRLWSSCYRASYTRLAQPCLTANDFMCSFAPYDSAAGKRLLAVLATQVSRCEVFQNSIFQAFHEFPLASFGVAIEYSMASSADNLHGSVWQLVAKAGGWHWQGGQGSSVQASRANRTNAIAIGARSRCTAMVRRRPRRPCFDVASNSGRWARRPSMRSSDFIFWFSSFKKRWKVSFSAAGSFFPVIRVLLYLGDRNGVVPAPGSSFALCRHQADIPIRIHV